MPTLYQRIIELSDTETAISLLHYLESDISTDGKTKKVLLSEISDLIDATIRDAIISEAVIEARKQNVHIVNDTDFTDNDTNNYTEIRIDPVTLDRVYTPPTHVITNGYKKIRIVNSGDGSHKITVNRYGASNLIVYSGNDPWSLTSIELIQAGDYIEIERDGTNWIKCNEPYWHTISNPEIGPLGTKFTGTWSADSFSGGLLITLTTLPIGTLAIRFPGMFRDTTGGTLFWRKNGDANISNTPYAATDHSHRLLYTGSTNFYFSFQDVVWLSFDFKVQFASRFTTGDLYIYHPCGYLQ